MFLQHEDEEKAPVSKPVFDREPEPLEWHIAKPNEINEYSILTVSTIILELPPIELALISMHNLLQYV